MKAKTLYVTREPIHYSVVIPHPNRKGSGFDCGSAEWVYGIPAEHLGADLPGVVYKITCEPVGVLDDPFFTPKAGYVVSNTWRNDSLQQCQANVRKGECKRYWQNGVRAWKEAYAWVREAKVEIAELWKSLPVWKAPKVKD